MNIWTILINYNGLSDTIDCIKSINSATYKTQILVVDNASDENEIEKIKANFQDVICMQNENNSGFAEGNNIGFRYAMEHGADYVLLLNNDTIIDNEMISFLIEKADSKTICVPQMLYFSEPNKIWYGGGNINKITGNIKTDCYNEIDKGNQVSHYCSFATGCCMLIPMEIIKKIGGLKKEYFMYCEDTEFCIRAMENQYKILYVPEAKLWHKVSASTGGAGSAHSIYYSSRNRLYYIQEHKKYFRFTAFFCALFSRYIRIVQCYLKRDELWKYYYKAVVDYKKRIVGKLDLK